MNIFEKKLKEIELLRRGEKPIEDKDALYLTLRETKLNLTKIGVGFYPNAQQIEVLENLIDFFNQPDFDEYTLEGYAGTGKTSIVKILLAYYWAVSKFKVFTLTAPTHKAKAQMEALAKKPTQTLHSLLGLYPDIELEDIDMDNLVFDKKNPTGILTFQGNLIIDESSMINDDLLELIQMKCAEFKVRVLYIGDPAQLKPVKQEHISKVFLNTKKSVLTIVERQSDDNPVNYLLDNLRLDEPEIIDWSRITNIIGERGEEKGIYSTHSSVDFIEHIRDQFSSEEYQTNKDFVRVLCYKNTRVTIFNNLVRQALGYTQNFQPGELLMAYDNHEVTNPLQKVLNSCDYVVLSSERENRVILDKSLPGYLLKLYCLQTQNSPTVFLLDSTTPVEERNKIGEELEFLRKEAISAGVPSAWRPYFELRNSFAATFPCFYKTRVVKKKLFDYGYAITVHKSQGATIRNVIVDVKDILSCQDPQQRQQLLYVALSRLTHLALVLAPQTEIIEEE